jgi:hypothetical protein
LREICLDEAALRRSLRVRRCRKCEQTTDSTEFREKLASRWHFHANLHLGPHGGPIPVGGLGGN